MEGKNRQIHRMVNAFNYRILHLHRHYFCGITLTGLDEPGSWKELNSSEMSYLHKFFIQKVPLKSDTKYEPMTNKFKSGSWNSGKIDGWKKDRNRGDDRNFSSSKSDNRSNRYRQE